MKGGSQKRRGKKTWPLDPWIFSRLDAFEIPILQPKFRKASAVAHCCVKRALLSLRHQKMGSNMHLGWGKMAKGWNMMCPWNFDFKKWCPPVKGSLSFQAVPVGPPEWGGLHTCLDEIWKHDKTIKTAWKKHLKQIVSVHEDETNQQAHFVDVASFLQINWISESSNFHHFTFTNVCPHLLHMGHQQKWDIAQVNDQATSKCNGPDCSFWIAIIGML